ncbi:MAG: integrase core domain-containing protein [Planctomycetota bacterium]|jgi:transposase InsO family protein
MDNVQTDLVEIMSLVKGNVERELLLRNEYLAAENEILRSRIDGRLLLTRHEKARLGRIGREIGVQGLKGLSHIVTPETVIRWFRELIAQKFDGSAKRGKPRGRRRVSAEKERLVCRFALDNATWGYTRIRGAMKNIGHGIGRSTIRRILERNGIPPAPRRARDSNWREFIGNHMHDTVAADFFTAEVVTPYALVTFYVLFFIHHATRRVLIAGITTNPDTPWMMQIARNVTMEGTGFLNGMKYLIHDGDAKFCPAFDYIVESAGVDLVPLPPRSPDLNAYAERFVLTVKSECLWRLLMFNEEGLWHAITEHVAHYHGERNHQSLDNGLLFPDGLSDSGDIECRKRLGGLLKYYYRKAG